MLKKHSKYQRNGTAAAGLIEYVRYSISEKLHLLFELVKIRITMLVSFTTGLGYILASGEITTGVIFPSAGIFLLACSSAALNQFQEHKTDLMMDRTKSRPIPSGRVNTGSVILLSVFLLASGVFTLLIFTNVAALITGLMTFYWYNGVYTPLKKRTSLAVIPGSLVGALPPLAGWLAAGGNIFDGAIIYVSAYFFVWQIPHFWLLLLLYGDDFKKGGFPVLSDLYNRMFIKRATTVLLLATALLGAFMPAAGLTEFAVTNILIAAASVLLVYVSLTFAFKKETERKDIVKTFVTINLYTLAVITLLTADKLFFLI